MKLRRYAILLSGVVALAGCGGGISMAPVSGTVYVDGQPKGGLSVIFQPVGTKGNENPGRGSYATTDANGRYTLKYDGVKPGAVVGKHRVAIATAFDGKKFDPQTGSPDGEAAGPREMIPARYNDQSELTFDVPAAGTDKADFKLDVGLKKK